MLKIILLPYNIWRCIVLRIAVFMWLEFAIKPVHLLIVCAAIMGCLGLVDYFTLVKWGKLINLALLCVMIVTQEQLENRSHKLEMDVLKLEFRLDYFTGYASWIIYYLVTCFLIWDIYLLATIQNYSNLVYDLGYGFFQVSVGGSGGRFWERLKVKNQRQVYSASRI